MNSARFNFIEPWPALDFHLLNPACFPLQGIREEHLSPQHLEAVAIALLVPTS